MHVLPVRIVIVLAILRTGPNVSLTCSIERLMNKKQMQNSRNGMKEMNKAPPKDTVKRTEDEEHEIEEMWKI